MSIGRRLRAIALLLTLVVAGLSGAAASAAGTSGAGPAGPAVTASDVCAGRTIRTSARGTCASSVVTPVDVARSTTPFHRLSGAWTAVPRPVTQALASTVETGGVTSCPRPPAADNHSRAPPPP